MDWAKNLEKNSIQKNSSKKKIRSKNFHRLNRKLDLEQTMNRLGKLFRKKSDPKNRKNSKK